MTKGMQSPKAQCVRRAMRAVRDARAEVNFSAFLSSYSIVLSEVKCVLRRKTNVQANASDRLQNDAKLAEKLAKNRNF